MSDFTDVGFNDLVSGGEINTIWMALKSGQDPDDFVRGTAVKSDTGAAVLDSAANFYGICTGAKTETHVEVYVSGAFRFEGVIAPTAVTLAAVFDYARAKMIILVQGV
jgi:hypothetical protein